MQNLFARIALDSIQVKCPLRTRRVTAITSSVNAMEFRKRRSGLNPLQLSRLKRSLALPANMQPLNPRCYIKAMACSAARMESKSSVLAVSLRRSPAMLEFPAVGQVDWDCRHG